MLYYKIHWDVYIFISAKAFLKLHLCSLCGSIVLPHSWIKDLSLQNNRNIPKIIRYLCQSFNISKHKVYTLILLLLLIFLDTVCVYDSCYEIHYEIN